MDIRCVNCGAMLSQHVDGYERCPNGRTLYEPAATPVAPPATSGETHVTSGDIIEAAYALHKDLSAYVPSLPVTHREARTVIERHIEKALKREPAPPDAALVARLRRDDLARLSRVFHATSDCRDEQDQRIAAWLAAALSARPRAEGDGQ